MTDTRPSTPPPYAVDSHAHVLDTAAFPFSNPDG